MSARGLSLKDMVQQKMHANKKKKNTLLVVGIVLLIVVALAAVGVVVYIFERDRKHKEEEENKKTEMKKQIAAATKQIATTTAAAAAVAAKKVVDEKQKKKKKETSAAAAAAVTNPYAEALQSMLVNTEDNSIYTQSVQAVQEYCSRYPDDYGCKALLRCRANPYAKECGFGTKAQCEFEDRDFGLEQGGKGRLQRQCRQILEHRCSFGALSPAEYVKCIAAQAYFGNTCAIQGPKTAEQYNRCMQMKRRELASSEFVVDTLDGGDDIQMITFDASSQGAVESDHASAQSYSGANVGKGYLFDDSSVIDETNVFVPSFPPPPGILGGADTITQQSPVGFGH